MPSTIKLIPNWSFASCWKDNGFEISTSLTINRRMFTSAKLQDDVQGGVTISTVVVVLALAHTHTHRHMEPSSDIIEVMVRTKTVMASFPLPLLMVANAPPTDVTQSNQSNSIWWKMPSFMAMFFKLYQIWLSYKWDEPSNQGLLQPQLCHIPLFTRSQIEVLWRL